MDDAILVLNAGSSSLKFRLYDIGKAATPTLVAKGQVEGIGVRPRFVASDATGAKLAEETEADVAIRGHADALQRLATWLRTHYGASMRLAAVGHRVVHGGVKYASPALVSEAVLGDLDRLVPLAPLHQPHNLAAIRAVKARMPQVPQVACFDTAFHRGHPELADRFALPEALYADGVRRYGFHGLSYEYIAGALPRVAPAIAKGRVVVAHLGSGASMCALKDGRSIDSTLGFTALDGLPMGTRCGAIDPGVLLYLISEKRLEPKAVERMLYNDSGLKGLSGVSNDVRDLLASDTRGARLALDYFVYRINRELGALAAVLGGLDGVVFTAGIGENAPEIRARICRAAAWSGVVLDEALNRAGGSRISAEGAAASAWVIPTDEEGMIAAHTLALVGKQTAAVH